MLSAFWERRAKCMLGLSAGSWTVSSPAHSASRLLPADLGHRDVMIGRTSCKMSPLVGAPFGAVFELDGNKLVRVDGELVEAEEEPPGESMSAASSAPRVTWRGTRVSAAEDRGGGVGGGVTRPFVPSGGGLD